MKPLTETATACAPLAVRTTCPYCGVGCGLLARADGHGGGAIEGDPDHPANFGQLCSKGAALGETLDLGGRLLHPLVRDRNGMLARSSWTEALQAVGDGFARVIARDGADAVAFYLSGQLLTEDYYVANKLMKGFIGSANVDTNSRLCMASSVAAHRRAFGADTVPAVYADLDAADLIVLVGSNAAWCHPVLFQRMVRNRRERGARIVVIDPRRTATAEEADLFLPLAPGADTALFCGLLVYLADHDRIDRSYLAAHTNGFDAALARARSIAPDMRTAAHACGLNKADVSRFFEQFATTAKVVTCFSQGVNQSAQGTDKANAIINCHLATGRIGKPGAAPFSLTGQPNAMGGREVGGLANQLAAHMNFTPPDIDRVRRFWHAPRVATREGRKAVAMFEAIARGEIKALWVMATNPAVSLPRARAMREALQKLELLVVSENVAATDTVHAGAHVVLPAAAWGERDGTVTNSERCISRQRSFLPPPGEARPDWWIVSQVAQRMGYAAAFSYASAADIFREHAALSAFENGGTRDFDLSAFAEITDDEYRGLVPTQWPARTGEPRGDRRFFAAGGFFTPDRKACFVPPEMPELRGALSEEFPFRLNTGRIRDQWHSMARSGRSARLGLHFPEPFVEIHPKEAAGLTHGEFARVTTAHGACVLKVVFSDGQRRGSLFVPIHWSGETSSSARVGDLVAPCTDPHSGQPEAKATPAAIAPITFALRGVALARRPVALPETAWWARVAAIDGFGYFLASNDTVAKWQEYAHALFSPPAELAEYSDAPRDTYRAAAFIDGRVEGCLFVGPAHGVPLWGAVKAVFAADRLDHAQRRVLLSGRPCDGPTEGGPVVCACFGVGLTTIRAALASRAAKNVEEIGEALRAGTNCGSCLPELKRIVARERAARGAETRAGLGM
ncbi:MAG: molybdopterin-dependent oxidoreductase [Proteobacteria bacterium]|nr:molybdopterin-dependent oxidoreductase [Pseudomonadota bacterium]